MKKLLCLVTVFQVVESYKGCGESPNVDRYRKKLNGIDHNNFRILGGHKARNGDWPWLVYLDTRCTGTLIHPRWVLTALHCRPFEWDTVIVGNTNYNKGEPYYIQKIIPSSKSCLKSEKDKCAIQKDIVLLKLSEKVKFNEKIHAICLSKNLPKDEMTHHVVVGWGKNAFTNRDREVAFEVTVPLRHQEYCSLEKEEKELCAGGVMRGTTEGDSGGPLMILKNDKWYQHGITSRGQEVEESGYKSDIGIYTDVTKFCDFIEKGTRGDVKCEN